MYGIVAAIQSEYAKECGGQESLLSSGTPLRGGIRSLRSRGRSSSKPGPLTLDVTPQRDSNRNSGTPFSPHRAEQMRNMLMEDFTLALKELQIFNADVVRAVQQWRSFLWRPLPFRWHGLDYLRKMTQDMSILDARGEGAGLGLGLGLGLG